MGTATASRKDVLAQYEPVIGLEVHCQLLTKTKLFCSCPNRFGDPPNTNVCPVCLGLPGALPVLSRKAVTLAMRAALATHCTVQEVSIFARKNYFYPDLPKGYQISQYERPLATEGYVEIRSGAPSAACPSNASTWRKTRASSCTKASPGRRTRAGWTTTGAACP